MFQFLKDHWPWYISGPLIGLMVPLLLIAGNKNFGVSSSFRHICAACIPAKIPFFQYDWKKEAWNLFFVMGILSGALIVFLFFSNPNAININPRLIDELKGYGIKDYSGLMPSDIFNWNNLLSVQGLVFTVIGGFLVGFGTRYAGGCTSGHSIMGLSTLQLPSLIATICFLAGGFFVANLILPLLLKM